MTIQELAQDLLSKLAPACERIEISGSIRRCKANPRDIEIVCVGKTEENRVDDLFGGASYEQIDLLDNALATLIGVGEWDFDPEVKRNGKKYKRLRHNETKICCDLFITTPECWGVIFTIRTGPGDYSKELVTRALRMGMVVEGGILYRVHRDNRRDMIPTPEEVDFFKALKLPFRKPAERVT